MSRVSNPSGLLNEPATVAERVAASVATAAVTLTREAHANRVIPLGGAAVGKTVTLPEAIGSGDVYEFFVPAAQTSGSIIVIAFTGDVMDGTVLSADVTGADIASAWHMTNAYKVTLNGTTTGGKGGDWLKFVDAADATWYVVGQTAGSGTLATPFTVTS